MESRNVYVIPNALSAVARTAICVHDPDALWPTLETEFLRRLKAVEYPWGGRTLRQLQVEIVDPHHQSLSYHASSPLDAYKIPFLHLYVFSCASLEEYKSAVRQRLRAWIDELRHVSNGLAKTEFLVVFVPQLHRVADVEKATLAAKKVHERIRADVNEGGKEERCARISVFQSDFTGTSTSSDDGKSSVRATRGGEETSGGDGVATGDGEWAELMGLAFRCLTNAFELRCRKFEDQVLKLEAQVDAPGWNYCTYLIVKENLAFTWLQIGQNYDALRVLDSLSMQFDNIIEGDIEPKRATNNLPIDLYRAQILRPLLLGRHVGAPAPLQDNPHPAKAQQTQAQAQPQGQGESATKAGLGEGVAPLGPEGATQLMGQSKVVAARLARRLSISLSFGASGTARIEGRKRRAESLAERSVYKGPAPQTPNDDEKEVTGEDSAPVTPLGTASKGLSAPTSARTVMSDDFDRDDDAFRTSSPGPTPESSSAKREPRARRAHLPPIPCHVLDAHRKPYREHIYKSAVSILEIRLYLFMRSTLVLFAVNRADEALRRGLHFVSTFARDLLHACDRWDSETEARSDADQPDRLAGRVIAFCWIITASLELVSAGHAARAGVGEPDAGPDVFLYQSELLAFAQSSFEHLVAEARGTSAPAAARNETGLPPRLWSTLAWIQNLPGFLTRVDAAARPVPSNVAAWVPPGIFYALSKQPIGVQFYEHLLSCRALHLRLAGRFRGAFRLDLRAAILWVSMGRVRDAQRVLHQIDDDEARAGTIRPWAELRAEHRLLSAHVQSASKNPETAVRHALRVVSMFGARDPQRAEALAVALKNAARLPGEVRMPGAKYDLLSWKVRSPASESRGDDLSRARSPRQGSRSRNLLVRRCGEVMSLELCVNSRFPSVVDFSRVYVRVKRLPPRAGLRVHIPRESRSNVRNMVRYRSSDAVGVPTAIDADASSGWDALLDDSDSEETVSPDTDFNTEEEGFTEDEELGFDHDNESLIRPSVASSDGGNLATLRDAITSESFKPLRVNAAALRRVSISSRMSSSEQSPTALKRNMSRVHYFDTTDVQIKPGCQQVVVVAPAEDDDGRLLAPGTYELDRVVFQHEKLRLVFPLDTTFPASASEMTRIELSKMPSLFMVEVVRPIGGFVSLDDTPDRPVEVELRLRKSDLARYPKLAGVRAKLDFGGSHAAHVPLRLCNGKDSDESEAVDLSAQDLETGADSGGPGGVVSKTIKFKIRVSAQHAKEVDCLLQPNKADMQILRRKGLKHNDSSLISSWELKVNLQTRLDQVDARGDRHEVALDQKETVTLRYGAPFEISQGVRFRAGRIWYQLTLRNNLPYVVTLREPRLTLEEGGDALERVSSRDTADVIAAGHEVYLTFSSAALPQLEPSAIHKLVFSTRYRPLADENSDGGIFERTVAMRQELDRRCLSVKSTCTNTDTVHLGSTATFVYQLGKPQADKTVRVESIFAESTSLINVSSSPLRKRHSSRRLRKPGAAGAGLEAAQGADALLVEFLLAFDPTTWMLVGTERGHIDLSEQDSVMCEFIPLQAGELSFPVLEVLNFESTEAGPRSFVRVADAT